MTIVMMAYLVYDVQVPYIREAIDNSNPLDDDGR